MLLQAELSIKAFVHTLLGNIHQHTQTIMTKSTHIIINQSLWTHMVRQHYTNMHLRPVMANVFVATEDATFEFFC